MLDTYKDSLSKRFKLISTFLKIQFSTMLGTQLNGQNIIISLISRLIIVTIQQLRSNLENPHYWLNTRLIL